MASSNIAEAGRIHGYPVDERRIQQYLQKVRRDERQGKLPDLEHKRQYMVYLMKDETSTLGLHWLLVLTSDGITGFSIELDNRYDDSGKYRIHPETRKIPIDKNKMTYKGRVIDSGWNLIQRALRVIRNFGEYILVYNNCQKYCNNILEEFGLGEGTEWTDGGAWGMLAAGIGGVLLVAYGANRIANNQRRLNRQ